MTDGFTASGLRRFDAVAASHVGDDKHPGLVALAARGGDVHVVALGALSIGGKPVERDSLFRIASTSKPITAAATLALVREGLLSLDEPVDGLLPELADPQVLARPDGPLDDTVPAVRAVTVRDLLTFTYGFGMVMEMFMSPEPWPVVAAASAAELGTFGPPEPGVQPAPDEWITRMGALPLVAQPGDRWLYNAAAQVLGVLCGRAADASYDDVVRTRITEPLGMRDTAFFTTATERLATSYRSTPDGLVVNDPPDGAWSAPPVFPDGAGGLLSTADDLLAFARMLLRGGEPIMSTDLAQQMTSDQLTPAQRAGCEAFLGDRSWGFGQAVAISGPRAGAYGWDGGLGTSWLVDPVRDLVVIVLTQRMWEMALPPAVHTEIQDAAYAAIT
jgi:CubicO group peptidase (beta-lactamase class C family)